MIKMDLKIDVCNNEMSLYELLGNNQGAKEKIKQIFAKIKEEHNNTCAYCEYQPKPNQKLKLHITELNGEDSIGVPLCDMCFSIKHFKTPVEKDQVTLVNSAF